MLEFNNNNFKSVSLSVQWRRKVPKGGCMGRGGGGSTQTYTVI